MSKYKQIIHKEFISCPPVEVECPEWTDPETGKPITMKFRARLTPADVETLQGLPRDLNALNMALFALLAQDEEGNRMVDPENDDWYRNQSSGMTIISVAERAGLIEKVLEPIFKDRGEKKTEEAAVEALLSG